MPLVIMCEIRSRGIPPDGPDNDKQLYNKLESW